MLELLAALALAWRFAALALRSLVSQYPSARRPER